MTILPDVCRAGANLAMFDLNNLKAVSDLNWKNVARPTTENRFWPTNFGFVQLMF